MIFLTPCEDCNRHVKTSESACPFCGAAVTAAMRARLPRLPKERLGRAAMVLFGATVATGTVACGKGDETRDKQQPASSNTTMPPGTDGTSDGDTGPTPSGSNTMVQMDPTPGSGGTPVTPPQGDPTAVAAYGVAIMDPVPNPNGPMPPPVDPPPMGEGGASSAEPEPMMEPEPSVAALYGLPADFGEAEAPDGSDAGAALDAGAGDAAAAEPEDEPEEMMEPEPSVVALYGVTPLESE